MEAESTYTRLHPLRVATLCSGYDSQCLALERLKRELPGFDYELVAWSDRNVGDMTAADWDSVPEFDLLTYSTPCQSISSAGTQEGMAEGSGTKSSLLWSVRRVIEAKRPEWLLMENVKALVSRKFMPEFTKWTGLLEGMGYVNSWKVLDARDFGVPQHRERVFMVSHLGGGGFTFPASVPLRRHLRDVLEASVDEHFYLPEGKVVALLDTMVRERAAREG